jgi:transcriptional regulator with XRE-family HTH domain
MIETEVADTRTVPVPARGRNDVIDRIESLMRDRVWTWSELALRCQEVRRRRGYPNVRVDANRFSKWWRHRVGEPSLRQAAIIAEALGVPLTDLVPGHTRSGASEDGSTVPPRPSVIDLPPELHRAIRRFARAVLREETRRGKPLFGEEPDAGSGSDSDSDAEGAADADAATSAHPG